MYGEAFDLVGFERVGQLPEGCCRGEGAERLTQRSVIEFMRGIRTPVSTVVILALLRISSIRAGYLASRSWMRNLDRGYGHAGRW